jgi:hypothetical protein
MTELTTEIIKDQSPKSLKACREKLMRLIVNGVPADLIIETLSENLVMKTFLTEKVKSEVVLAAAFYDHR